MKKEDLLHEERANTKDKKKIVFFIFNRFGYTMLYEKETKMFQTNLLKFSVQSSQDQNQNRPNQFLQWYTNKTIEKGKNFILFFSPNFNLYLYIYMGKLRIQGEQLVLSFG